MSRFYVDRKNVGKKEIVIDGEQAHHILDVMRMKDGDQVVVFDGTGKEYTGFIKDINKSGKKMVVEIIRTACPALDSTAKVTLVQAIPKKSKMENIVEKATELGVSSLIPMVSSRTIVRPDEVSSKKKVERWNRVAVEASKQCGRTDVPGVGDIAEFSDVVKGIDEYDLVLFACLSEGTVPLKGALSGVNKGKIIVFIGPEGGFTPEEISLASIGNTKLVSLGRLVLKSDTAGLFVLSAINYELG